MSEHAEVQETQDDKIKAVAEELVKSNKKVQLIYAFNGTGKTRLSRAVKELVAPKPEDGEEKEPTRRKILYYSAFTEDLFVWDNDKENDEVRKIDIQPNSFTDWVLRDRGQDQNIVANFQRYTSRSITPSFPLKSRLDLSDRAKKIDTFPEVRFAYTGGDNIENNIKISKGEESNLIWSVFYTLLQEVVELLTEPDPEKRDDDVFDDLKVVFIDDPVSSLDDSHLIELAVDLAELIKTTESNLKFIITTHNPLFYNVLFNEFNNKKYKGVEKVKASLQAAIANGGEVVTLVDAVVAPDDRENVVAALQASDNDAAIAAVIRPKLIYKPNHSAKYRLSKAADGSFALAEQGSDSPFSYHLLLLSDLKKAVDNGQVQKFHFNYLRNVLEKTSTFLGYNRWGDLLPKIDGNPDPFASRIVNLSSHSAHSGEEVAELERNDQEKLGELVNYLFSYYHFFEPKDQNA
ncbi:AAA family ATPase [Ruegeria sp.]|uniref:AAA family ATPase n=1 Tax=Ruegeria sp. TaxID=1879320 RepID=UPI0023088FA8|nr:AAA family ATPase [Ruegeria sp.]MDA7966393.1 AAA family ATPase [Ruegeria sp.]